MSKVMIDFLVRRLFPDADICGEIDRLHDQKQPRAAKSKVTRRNRYCRCVQSFEETLQYLTPEFVKEIYDREKNNLPVISQKWIDRKISREMLECGDIRPDYEFWIKAEIWTREESVALALNLDPAVASRSEIRRLIGESKIADRYERLFQLAERSVLFQDDDVDPVRFAQWIRDNRHDCEKEFQALFLDKTEARVDTLQRQNLRLKDKIKDLENIRIDPRVHETLQKLVVGYAVGAFAYNPRRPRNKAVPALLAKTPEFLRIDEKTANTHLAKAAERFAADIEAWVGADPAAAARDKAAKP